MPKLKVDAKTCDAFLEDAERRVGVTVPRFSYFRVETAAEVSRLTGAPFAGGIAMHSPPRTWSMRPCLRHELAHFVAYELALPRVGRSDAFWHEGFAAWLANDYGFYDRWNLRQSLIHEHKRARDVPWAITRIRREVPSISEREGEYRIAQAFVNHLVKEYGEEKFLSFFRLMGKLEPELAFVKTYGMPVATASARWLD
jgi:hypothetical protein